MGKSQGSCISYLFKKDVKKKEIFLKRYFLHISSINFYNCQEDESLLVPFSTQEINVDAEVNSGTFICTVPGIYHFNTALDTGTIRIEIVFN